MNPNAEEHREKRRQYAAKAEGPFSLLRLAVRDVAYQLHAFRRVLPEGEWTSRIEPPLHRLQEATTRLLEAVKQLHHGLGSEAYPSIEPDRES
jgi:hypothetical protein